MVIKSGVYSGLGVEIAFSKVLHELQIRDSVCIRVELPPPEVAPQISLATETLKETSTCWDQIRMLGMLPSEVARRSPDQVRDLVEQFQQYAGTRQAVIERVIGRGGLYDADGKWVEIAA